MSAAVSPLRICVKSERETLSIGVDNQATTTSIRFEFRRGARPNARLSDRLEWFIRVSTEHNKTNTCRPARWTAPEQIEGNISFFF